MPAADSNPARDVPVGILPRLLRAFTVRLPLRSGFGKLANGGYLPPLPRGPRWVRLRDGGRILCQLHDYIGNALFYFGDLDAKVSWVLKKTLRTGDTFLDLGANVGILTVLGARLVGKEGRVLAVEPNPAVIAMLEETLAANECHNVTIGRYALGEENGELPLQVPEGNIGGGALGKSGDEGVTVPVRVLREVLAEEGLDTPRTVKIDVEGFEVPVLRGVLDTWSSHPPEVVLFEHRDHDPAADSEIGEILQQLGFELYRLPRRWFGVSLAKEEPSEFDWREVSPDVVAVQPGSPAAADLGLAK